jgi:hypothetical protein
MGKKNKKMKLALFAVWGDPTSWKPVKYFESFINLPRAVERAYERPSCVVSFSPLVYFVESLDKGSLELTGTVFFPISLISPEDLSSERFSPQEFLIEKLKELDSEFRKFSEEIERLKDCPAVSLEKLGSFVRFLPAFVTYTYLEGKASFRFPVGALFLYLLLKFEESSSEFNCLDLSQGLNYSTVTADKALSLALEVKAFKNNKTLKLIRLFSDPFEAEKEKLNQTGVNADFEEVEVRELLYFLNRISLSSLEKEVRESLRWFKHLKSVLSVEAKLLLPFVLRRLLRELSRLRSREDYERAFDLGQLELKNGVVTFKDEELLNMGIEKARSLYLLLFLRRFAEEYLRLLESGNFYLGSENGFEFYSRNFVESFKGPWKLFGERQPSFWEREKGTFLKVLKRLKGRFPVERFFSLVEENLNLLEEPEAISLFKRAKELRLVPLAALFNYDKSSGEPFEEVVKGTLEEFEEDFGKLKKNDNNRRRSLRNVLAHAGLGRLSTFVSDDFEKVALSSNYLEGLFLPS